MQLFTGEEVEELFRDTSFMKGWRSLLEMSSFATVFQSPEFVITWYKTFPNYKRIVVCEFESGLPSGILFLTQDQNDTIVGAGTNMAEYQTWICRPDDSSFPLRAFELLVKHFPAKLFQVKYVPDATFHFPQKRKIDSNHSLFSTKHIRPLMENDISSLEKELKKKNRKEKLNRLNRIGKLEYEKIEDLARFQEVLPLLVLQNDLRKGALYGKTAFVDEPERNDFLLRLFESNLLHASLLKVNDEIIASNVGILGDGKVYLQGLNTISPYYSKYSPGILHFLILGKHLAMEGIPEFDLTPGGTDGYKSMLSTKTVPCQEIFVGKIFRIQRIVAKQKIREWFGNKAVSKVFANSLSELSSFNALWANLKISVSFTFSPFSDKILQNRNAIEIDPNQTVQWRRVEGYRLESGNLKSFFSIGKRMDLYKRQKFYQDCLKRMELGQKFFAIHFEKEYKGLIWLWTPRELQKTESEGNGVLYCDFSFIHSISKTDRLALASRIFSLELSGTKPKCILLV
jgi:CelD/BcsL family acetyltransferase involved in cellulose biosynthesis